MTERFWDWVQISLEHWALRIGTLSTDEPVMPSSAPISFAPTWKWTLMVANFVKMMMIQGKSEGWCHVLWITLSSWERGGRRGVLKVSFDCALLSAKHPPVGLYQVAYLYQPVKWKPMKWNGILSTPSNVFVWDCYLTPVKWEWGQQSAWSLNLNMITWYPPALSKHLQNICKHLQCRFCTSFKQSWWVQWNPPE